MIILFFHTLITTTGNCCFSVSNEGKRYVANYLDATLISGWRDFHFGAGTQFIDFNPAASISEPKGPVSLLESGYTVEHTTETLEGIEYDI